MNYNQWSEAVETMLNVPSTEVDLIKIKPRMIEYAELRIYRELDFISTITRQTGPLTANSRDVTMPDSIIILRSMNVITPAATAPDAGTRNPLLRVGYDFMDNYWPAVTGSAVVPSVPKFYSLLDNTKVVVAPTPDSAYQAEFVGTVRPAPLSESNASTFLTLNVPDLFLSASLIFGFAYQQNFGAASDDPKTAMSWESTYQTQFAGVNVETIRQKAASVSWSPYQPTPQANTSRDHG